MICFVCISTNNPQRELTPPINYSRAIILSWELCNQISNVESAILYISWILLASIVILSETLIFIAPTALVSSASSAYSVTGTGLIITVQLYFYTVVL